MENAESFSADDPESFSADPESFSADPDIKQKLPAALYK